MLYAGIDLGTSSVKMILCDEKGNVKKSVTREYKVYFPREGYSEQNPEDWYKETVEGLKILFEGVGREVKGLGISGQMHGLVMLDENDCVIRPAILWNDSRSVKECEYLNKTIGEEKIAEYTANIAFPGFTAPKIMWVRDNEGENFSRCKKIMLPKDYLVYMLTGVFSTEASDASGMLLFDVEKGSYSKAMLDICSINEGMLPKVYPSYAPVGKLKREICEIIGACDVTVCPGAGDNAGAAIGMGVIGEGGCSVSLGTSGTVFITSRSFKKPLNNAIHSFRHADSYFHLMGCILSAASCNKWWVEDILKTHDYTEAEKIEVDGENKVFYLPYMMGERSPHNDPYARGVFAGMSMDTKRLDMTKAIMEGVCYALRDSVEAAREEGVEINEVRLCGGGARSNVWCRMLANILRVRIVKPVCTEGPAFGAAILALVAAGEYKTVGDACREMVKIGDKIDFDEAVAQKYDKGYVRFKKLYEGLKDWYRDEE